MHHGRRKNKSLAPSYLGGMTETNGSEVPPTGLFGIRVLKLSGVTIHHGNARANGEMGMSAQRGVEEVQGKPLPWAGEYLVRRPDRIKRLSALR